MPHGGCVRAMTRLCLSRVAVLRGAMFTTGGVLRRGARLVVRIACSATHGGVVGQGAVTLSRVSVGYDKGPDL